MTLSPRPPPPPPNSHEHSKSESAVLAVKIMVHVFLVGYIILCASDLRGFFGKQAWFARRKENVYHRQNFILRSILFVNVLLNILAFSMVLFTVAVVPYPHDVSVCETMTRISSVCYSLSFQTIFLFFVFRMSFVEGIVRSRTYKIVSAVTKFGLIVFVPAYAIPNTFIYMHGVITHDGVCVPMNRDAWSSMVFIAGTCLLSLTVLYLFIAPLQASLAVLNPASASRLKRVMARNIALSFFAIATTIISLTVFTWLNLRTDATDYHLILSYITALMDIFLLGISARLMIMERCDVASRKRQYFECTRRWFSCCPCCRMPAKNVEQGEGPSGADNETLPLPSGYPIHTGLVAV